LPHIATAALALGLLESFWLKHAGARWALRFILLELLLWQLFQPYINHPFPSRRWTAAATILNMSLTSGLLLAFWLALDLLIKQTTTTKVKAVLPTALSLLAAGSAISVVLAYSLVMAQLTGVLTACLAAVAVGCWLFNWRLSSATTPLITLLLALPWLSLYTTLPLLTVLLLALAPWLLLLRFEARPFWQQVTFPLLLTAMVTGMAVLNAWRLT
jgi:hypothetical protein